MTHPTSLPGSETPRRFTLSNGFTCLCGGVAYTLVKPHLMQCDGCGFQNLLVLGEEEIKADGYVEVTANAL